LKKQSQFYERQNKKVKDKNERKSGFSHEESFEKKPILAGLAGMSRKLGQKQGYAR